MMPSCARTWYVSVGFASILAMGDGFVLNVHSIFGRPSTVQESMADLTRSSWINQNGRRSASFSSPFSLTSSKMQSTYIPQEPSSVDYYEVLGVDPSSDTREIKSAYRQLVKLHHPDAHPERRKSHDEENILRINRAYHILSHPLLRQRYDRFGERGLDLNSYPFPKDFCDPEAQHNSGGRRRYMFDEDPPEIEEGLDNLYSRGRYYHDEQGPLPSAENDVYFMYISTRKKRTETRGDRPQYRMDSRYAGRSRATFNARPRKYEHFEELDMPAYATQQGFGHAPDFGIPHNEYDTPDYGSAPDFGIPGFGPPPDFGPPEYGPPGPPPDFGPPEYGPPDIGIPGFGTVEDYADPALSEPPPFFDAHYPHEEEEWSNGFNEFDRRDFESPGLDDPVYSSPPFQSQEEVPTGWVGSANDFGTPIDEFEEEDERPFPPPESIRPDALPHAANFGIRRRSTSMPPLYRRSAFPSYSP